MTALAIVIALVAVIAAVVTQVRARGLAAELADRAIDHRAALDRVTAERDVADQVADDWYRQALRARAEGDSARRWLATTVRIARKLRWQIDLDIVEATVTYETALDMCQHIGDQLDSWRIKAVRLQDEVTTLTADSDAHDARCVELAQLVTELERQRDSAQRWLRTTIRIARLLRGRLAESDAAFRAVREMRDALESELRAVTADRDAIAARASHDEPRANPCSRLDEYFDGELDAATVEAFRGHLGTCERCQRVLHGRVQETVVTHVAPPEAGQ